ncbi:MAG: hypothetical protein KGZ83_21280 [Sulfuricella sp.]|nr:hypothetical protein [Sulfuricella sp.]
MKFQKLALLIEQAHITVSLWTFGLKGWGISRTEKVSLPTTDPLADQVLAAIRPLVLKWGIAPDTPVMTVVPAGVGGFLSFSLPVTAGKDLDTLIDVEIGKSLPFSVREVEKSYQLVKEKDRVRVSVLWMPKLWVNELKNALARIGLRLSELFHRAQLVGGELGGTGDFAASPWGCIEQDGKAIHFHFFRMGSIVERSRSLVFGESGRLVQELNLDLLSLSCIDLAPRRIFLAGVEGVLSNALVTQVEPNKKGSLQTYERKLGLPELLLALWKKGGSGVWLVPDRSTMMARLTPWVIALVAICTVAAGALWWTVLGQREQSSQLESDVKKIKSKFQKASSVESEVIRTQLEINGIQAATRPGEPLAALYEVFKALPEKAWLISFKYDEKEVAVEGYGVDGDTLQAALKTNPRFAGFEALTPQVAVDGEHNPFALKMKWKAAPPAPPAAK